MDNRHDIWHRKSNKNLHIKPFNLIIGYIFIKAHYKLFFAHKNDINDPMNELINILHAHFNMLYIFKWLYDISALKYLHRREIFSFPYPSAYTIVHILFSKCELTKQKISLITSQKKNCEKNIGNGAAEKIHNEIWEVFYK